MNTSLWLQTSTLIFCVCLNACAGFLRVEIVFFELSKFSKFVKNLYLSGLRRGFFAQILLLSHTINMAEENANANPAGEDEQSKEHINLRVVSQVCMIVLVC